jgi:hypothetical protein
VDVKAKHKKESSPDVSRVQQETVPESVTTVEQQPVVDVAESTESTEPAEGVSESVSETTDHLLLSPLPRGRETEQTPISAPIVSQPVALSIKDKLETEIESVLEEDLTELYLAMPPDQQRTFKMKGEEVRSQIRQLVRELHVNAKKIFHLIRAWLKLIPGVNRFFLEQEAKIKTDKVLLVTEEEKRRGTPL